MKCSVEVYILIHVFYFLLIYPVVLFLIESRIFTFATNITEMCISAFNSVSFCFMYFEVPLKDERVFIIVTPSDELTLISS